MNSTRVRRRMSEKESKVTASGLRAVVELCARLTDAAEASLDLRRPERAASERGTSETHLDILDRLLKGVEPPKGAKAVLAHVSNVELLVTKGRVTSSWVVTGS
jgi:hypothetical protein